MSSGALCDFSLYSLNTVFRHGTVRVVQGMYIWVLITWVLHQLGIDLHFPKRNRGNELVFGDIKGSG